MEAGSQQDRGRVRSRTASGESAVHGGDLVAWRGQRKTHQGHYPEESVGGREYTVKDQGTSTQPISSQCQ